jgi:sugar/nucleoside kinase (ribokinase family)
VHVPARRVTGEIDFCGAGDTFLSGFAASIAGGFSVTDAARIACCCSSVTIKKLKTTGTADRRELAAALKGYGK